MSEMSSSSSRISWFPSHKLQGVCKGNDIGQRGSKMERALKYNLLVSVGMIYLLAGCANTLQTTESWSPQSSDNLSRMNQEISGKKVTVFLEDGQVIQASDVYLAEDTTSGFTIGMQRFNLATNSIRSLQLRNPSQKVYGLLGGAVLGAVIGYTTAEEGTCKDNDNGWFSSGWLCTTKEENQLFGALILSPVLGSLGYLIAPGPEVKTYVRPNNRRP